MVIIIGRTHRFAPTEGKTVLSASSVPKNKNTKNQKKITTMENQKESVWSTVLRIVITILTAIATSLGVQSCM